MHLRKKTIKWQEEDPRDISANIEGKYILRVKAEKKGTIWVASVTSENNTVRSEHTSKPAAKQKCAKLLRSLLQPKNATLP